MGWTERLKTGGHLLDARLFGLGGASVSLGTVFIFVCIIIATLIVSRILQRLLVQALRIRGVTAEGTVAAARRLLHYVVMAIGIAVGLETIGINLAALFAAGAIFAIGLSFAMQNIAQNFVSGLILLLERSIKPNDVLQVEGRVVKVKKMGIRATIARTRDDEEIIVPNSSLVQSVVTNYTLDDSLFRLRTTVGVTYDSDMAQVKKVLGDTARSTPWRWPGREPLVQMTEFKDSSVEFEVSVWMDNPWRARRTKAELNEAIWWALKEAGIKIAFPQMDVHFDPGVSGGLESLGRIAPK